MPTLRVQIPQVVAGQCAFFATTALLGALMGKKYTSEGQDYLNVVSTPLNALARAGILAGLVFTLTFLANVLTACITMAKAFLFFCKDNDKVIPLGRALPVSATPVTLYR